MFAVFQKLPFSSPGDVCRSKGHRPGGRSGSKGLPWETGHEFSPEIGGNGWNFPMAGGERAIFRLVNDSNSRKELKYKNYFSTHLNFESYSNPQKDRNVIYHYFG
jgi:hypothetical protein